MGRRASSSLKVKVPKRVSHSVMVWLHQIHDVSNPTRSTDGPLNLDWSLNSIVVLGSTSENGSVVPGPAHHQVYYALQHVLVLPQAAAFHHQHAENQVIYKRVCTLFIKKDI